MGAYVFNVPKYRDLGTTEDGHRLLILWLKYMQGRLARRIRRGAGGSRRGGGTRHAGGTRRAPAEAEAAPKAGLACKATSPQANDEWCNGSCNENPDDGGCTGFCECEPARR